MRTRPGSWYVHTVRNASGGDHTSHIPGAAGVPATCSTNVCSVLRPTAFGSEAAFGVPDLGNGFLQTNLRLPPDDGLARADTDLGTAGVFGAFFSHRELQRDSQSNPTEARRRQRSQSCGGKNKFEPPRQSGVA